MRRGESLLNRRSSPVKRALDMSVATLALVVMSPVLFLVGAAIRLTSRGSALYGARRIGRGGRPFVMWKFRTMRGSPGPHDSPVTATDDPRITRLGSVLRATKVDELPQLVNVLRGEMSLVGPRPEAPEFVSLDDPLQREVLSVRPGITGPTQLEYRHEERMLSHASAAEDYRSLLLPKKIDLDLQYVRSASFREDLRLLTKTVWRLVS
jgi:lipopolysaccharide/colanic/teichoic acid biosynthesis glycosyltransferase